MQEITSQKITIYAQFCLSEPILHNTFHRLIICDLIVDLPKQHIAHSAVN